VRLDALACFRLAIGERLPERDDVVSDGGKRPADGAVHAALHHQREQQRPSEGEEGELIASGDHRTRSFHAA
jgi:hypothetical protein